MNHRKTHQSYWNSEAGRELWASIQGLIQDNHLNGEQEPEKASVCLAKAAGNREVLTLVQSLTAELKGGVVNQ